MNATKLYSKITRGPRVLNKHERDTLLAAIVRIFPEKGTEASAFSFILKSVLADKAQKEQKQIYEKGLSTIDLVSVDKFHVNFVNLKPKQQDEVLQLLEKQDPSIASLNKAPTFFMNLRNHVIQGIFCDPKYGGNENHRGWKLVKYTGYRQTKGYSQSERGSFANAKM